MMEDRIVTAVRDNNPEGRSPGRPKKLVRRLFFKK
jgi:hypothetical protein